MSVPSRRTPLINLTTIATRRAIELGLGTLSSARVSRASADADPDYGRPAEPDWIEVDWSDHLHEVPVRGRLVRYVDVGEPDRPPVVLVHGISSNWQNWLEQLPTLAAAGYRAVALDLPGFGHSPMPDGEISMPSYAAVVDEFCAALGLGAVSLVGHSMGGLISAETAISSPERVERLVIVGAAGISHVNVRRAPVAVIGRVYPALAARKLIQLDWVVRRPHARDAVLTTLFRHPSLIRPELVFEIVRGAGAEAFPAALRAIVTHDFREQLPKVDCPTLIVWGAEDMLVPLEDSEEFERLIPNARRIVMDDTGHMINSERPRAFNEALLQFLAERGHAERAQPSAVGARQADGATAPDGADATAVAAPGAPSGAAPGAGS